VLERLEDPGRATDAVKVFLARIVGRRVALSENRDDRRRKVVDVFNERYGLLPTDVERRHGTRKENCIADRQDG
jgi:hypothetical protein